MTTLGYGDVMSVTPVGRLIAVFEAMRGQFFLAFLVARLICVYSFRYTGKQLGILSFAQAPEAL